MARIGKITKVLSGIESYSYLMNGVAGIGKTTTVCEIGQKKFGQDGFLLMTLGAEPEPSHIGNLWNVVIDEWDELEETIDTLIEERNTEYKDLKMIGIDSTGELFRLAEAKVIEEYNRTVSSSDKVKSIQSAYGGFYRGQTRAIEIVSQLMSRLSKAGYSLFYIGHTKQKNKTDQMTGVEYEQVTSDMENKYFNAIKDRVNIVMCAYMEREMADITEETNKFNKKKIKVGDIVSESRVVSFRDETFSLDLKCHLKHIVPKCELDSDIIIKELESAITKQVNDFGGKTETKEKVVKERQESKPKSEELTDDKKFEIVDTIKNNLAKLDMSELQKIMSTYGFKDFNNVTSIPTKALKEIVALIK